MNADVVKKSITMRQVAELYGFVVNRSNFIKCPFHSDKTASCKIYENSFYCFGCSAGGDLIKFVQTINNCTFPQALSELNKAFNLGLDLFAPVDRKAQSKRLIERKNQEALEQWSRDAFLTLSEYHRFLLLVRFPKNPYFAESLLNLEKINYYCECINNDPEDFFKKNRKAVNAIEQRLLDIFRDVG